MRDTIINLQKSNTWKIQLTIAINFISSKDVDEEHAIHSKRNNIEFMSCDNANGVVDEILSHFFEYNKLVQKHQWEGAILFSILYFDSYYRCQKISFKCGRSYIDSPGWTQHKKATINPKNEDDKCFQYAATAALN